MGGARFTWAAQDGEREGGGVEWRGGDGNDERRHVRSLPWTYLHLVKAGTGGGDGRRGARASTGKTPHADDPPRQWKVRFPRQGGLHGESLPVWGIKRGRLPVWNATLGSCFLHAISCVAIPAVRGLQLRKHTRMAAFRRHCGGSRRLTNDMLADHP